MTDLLTRLRDIERHGMVRGDLCTEAANEIERLREIKPFLVLAGATYYPSRWNDYAGSAETLDQAVAIGQEAARNEYRGWWQVIDLRSMSVVKRGEEGRVYEEGECRECGAQNCRAIHPAQEGA